MFKVATKIYAFKNPLFLIQSELAIFRKKEDCFWMDVDELFSPFWPRHW